MSLTPWRSYIVHEAELPVLLPECRQCIIEDHNLYRLKKTNNELRRLIDKLDDLSDSFDASYREQTESICHKYAACLGCSICHSLRELNRLKCECALNFCKQCERMLLLSRELTEKPIIVDNRIFPLDKYPSGSQYYCDKCEKCQDELSAIRRSRSRTRSNSRCRSSSSDTYCESYEQKPLWNGGPYKSYYAWRDYTLKNK
jgi:hypothetical protein